MIVLDASAAVELLLGRPAGRAVAERIGFPAEALHAPHLLDVEVAQVLRRYEALGTVTPLRARNALQALVELDVRRYDHRPLLPRAWELRHNLTAYDAIYIALAEVLDAPLLTTDTRLAGAPGHRARVEIPTR